ncbi:putative sugar transporter, partial [Operophtera brumata]
MVTAPIGRRRAMQLVNLPFFVAWLMFHFSTNTGHLYGALSMSIILGVFTQFLFGLFLYWRVVALVNIVFTVGAIITGPCLWDGLARAHLCGFLSATSSMSIILGVLTQFLFGLFLYWRVVALVNIVFTSLQWLRGWTTPEAVERELKEIQVLFKNEKVKTEDSEDSFADEVALYFKKSFLIPYFLVCFSFFVGHFSGMTTLQMLEAPIDKYYATLILGIIQIVGTGVCVLLVHFTGKRPLTLISTAGGAICCLLYGIPEVNTVNTTMNVDFVTGGMQTVIVFSAKTRSGGAGLASAVGYIFGFLTNKMYISMVD